MNIPIPEQLNSFVSLDTLKVGEFTTFPRRGYDSIRVSAAFRTRRLGFKFVRQTEGEVGRVWRTQ